MDKRPNLFSHGTSELSQDAFICWLAEWANPIYEGIDECLHEAGIDFIRRIYDLYKKNLPAEIKKVKVTKKFKGISYEVLMNTFMPLPPGEKEQRIIKKQKNY